MNKIAQLLGKVRSNSLARNSGWMFLGQGMSVVIQGLYFLLLGRLLGSTEYGIYIGAVSLVSIVSPYSTLGSGWMFVRHVSPDHSKFSCFWGNILMATFMMGGFLVAGLSLTAHWFISPASAALVLLVALGECFCGQLAEACGRVFQAFEKFRYTATLNTLTNFLRFLTAAAMLAFMGKTSAYQWAVASLSVSVFAGITAVCVVTVRFGLPKFSPRNLFSGAGEGFGYSIGMSTTVIYNDIDKTMLSHYGMSAANGIYAMAYRAVNVCTMPIMSIHSAAFPRFFKRGAKAGVSDTAQFAVKLLSKTTILGLVAAIAMFVSAPLIPIVVGKSFGDSVLALRWLCLLPFIRSFHLSAGDALTGAGFQRYRTASQLIAAGMNAAMNVYAIPRFSWQGAACTSLITDASLALMNWLLVWMLVRERRAAAPLPKLAEA